MNVKPAEMVPALDSGDLDAYVIWQPFGWKSAEVSGDKVRQLSTAAGYFTEYVMVSTRKSLLDNDLDAASTLIQCMQKGAEYAANNPDDAAAAVGKFCNVPPETVMTMMNVMTPQSNNTAQMRDDLNKLNEFMVSKDKSDKQLDFGKHFDSRALQAVRRGSRRVGFLTSCGSRLPASPGGGNPPGPRALRAGPPRRRAGT